MNRPHAVSSVPDGEVDKLLAEYDELYDVAPALREGGDQRESLRYGARIEAGLRAWPAARTTPC